MIRTTVYLDQDYEDLKPLLKRRGVTNFSEVCRDLIMFLIGDGETELTKTQIRELTSQFAKMKLAELQKQQKITGATEEEKQKIDAFRAKRMAKIIESVKVESSRIGTDRFKRYLDDPYGDYAIIQDDIIAAVSQASGYQVNLADLIQAFKAVSS